VPEESLNQDFRPRRFATLARPCGFPRFPRVPVRRDLPDLTVPPDSPARAVAALRPIG